MSQTDLVQTEQGQIDLLHGLVAIPSLSHGEADAVSYLVAEMAKRGLDAYVDAVGSAVGTVGQGERHIVLLGHIDTVPGTIPVRIEDGLLWGRGSVDAKGPLATFVAAAACAADRLQCRVTVVGAVGEETLGSPGATEVAKWASPDLCIIGEPSGWDAICLGYRGVYGFTYELLQAGRHTAGPGESVGEQAVGFWNALIAEADRINGAAERMFDRISPSLRAFNTDSDGLHDTARLNVGLRLPPETDIPALVDAIGKLADEATLITNGLQAGYRTDKRSPLTAPFLRAIRAQGGTPRFTHKLGTSDMTIVGPVWRCPIVAYGPGDASLDHTPDERIVLSDYLRAVRVLTDVLTSLH